MRLSTRRLMLLIAIVVGLLWLLDQSRATWVGSYDLGVTVTGPSIRSLFCVVCSDKYEADGFGKMWMKPTDPNRLAEWQYQDETFTGKPFAVPVRTAGVRTGLGRAISDGQKSGLFIAVLYEDGTRGFKSSMIPHRSVSRQFQVSFP